MIEKKKSDSHRSIKQKIKILRIISRLNIGGPAIHCSILAEGLNNKRFSSKLLTGTISPHEGDMSYLIGKVSKNNLLKLNELQREIKILKDLIAFIKILRILFKEKPDIVHSHLSKAGTISRVAVFIHNLISRKKILSVHTYHGHVLDGYFSSLKSKLIILIEKSLGFVTDAVIAISQTQKWELTEKYKIAGPEKVHTINLGSDLARFSTSSNKSRFRSQFKIEEDSLLIGIVGRLVPIKNHRLFLDAAKLVKNKYRDKKIIFVVIGDGELRSNLEKYAQQLGIEEFVIFAGWQRDLTSIYADLDIVVLTSMNEGTPVSIIEAMSASVPVVTTGVGGIKDLLGKIVSASNTDNGFKICERGILCPKNNPVAFAKGIGFILENDLSRSSNRIMRAKKYVLENYSDKKLISNIESLYEELL